MNDGQQNEPSNITVALRLPASLKRRIEACQADVRIQSGVGVTEAAIIRALLTEALDAREGRSGA